MSKYLEKIKMFISGDPLGAPNTVMFSFDIADGNARDSNLAYELESPDHSDTIQELWNVGVAAIKSQYGIG